MKIDIWTPDILDSGGITTVARDFTDALRLFEHDLRVFGMFDPAGQWNGVPVRGTLNLPAPLRTVGFASLLLLSGIQRRPDQVISIHLNFASVAHWAKRLLGIPFILVAHGMDVRSDLSAAKIAGIRAADRILAVSDWTRQLVLGLEGIDPSRVHVLHNTMDEKRFTVSARPGWLAARYNIHSDEKIILTVARLESGEGYKGCDRILRSLPSIRKACGPVRFLIVGRGDDRARLEKLTTVLGLHDCVTFVGFVPDDELPAYYQLADVFAMPSTGEGFGIVFLEAMACGTPVLAGNKDGSVDALDGGRLGYLVNPGDNNAIALGITALLTQVGPRFWFSRQELRDTVIKRFGHAVFRANLQKLLTAG